MLLVLTVVVEMCGETSVMCQLQTVVVQDKSVFSPHLLSLSSSFSLPVFF